jgi:zinc protease
MKTMLSAIEGGLPGFSQDVLDTERQRAVNDMDAALRSTQRFALEIGDWAAIGDWRLFFLHRDRLRTLTLADVQRVAERYLKAGNRTVAELVPTAVASSVEVPIVADAAALVSKHISRNHAVDGEPFEPSPSNIEARIERASIAPGLNVAFLRKHTRGAEVHAILTLRFGDAQSLKNRRWAGYLAGQMLLRGSRYRTREQIQDELTRAGARVQLYSAANHVTVSIAATNTSIAHVLRVVAEVLRDPAFSEAEFDELKRSVLLSVAREKGDPDAASWYAVYRVLHPYPPGDLRRVQDLEEKIASMSRVALSNIRAFHKEFYGASHGELTVVGDFDSVELRRVAEECFGGWRSPHPYRRLARNYQAVPATDLAMKQPGRHNAAFQAGVAIPISRNSPEYPALLVGTYVMGGGFLSSRLPSRVRKQEGLSYWIESGLYGGTLDSVLTFITSAACEPDKLSGLKTAFADELERSLREGFRTEEVENAKLAWQRQRQIELADNSQLVWDLASDLFAGRTRHWHAEFDRRIASITAEEVTAAWRKYIRPSALVTIEAGDLPLS